jgi:hypothetical protein
MGMRIRQLRIRVETDRGLFGTDIPFSAGLNVLWADNTKGKSTCMQSIMFALGLEKMFGASRDLPLQYAVTDYLEVEDSLVHANVIHSSVWLEIENDDKKIVTIRRRIKTDQSYKLVTVFDGPMLTSDNNDLSATDYFTVDPGSASTDAGFYPFLANFIGWDLPTVSRYNGLESPLYVETIFPLFFVEQKSGWSEFPAAFPTHFGIREVGRRAVEFVMGLGTHQTEIEKQRLAQELLDLKAQWLAKRQEIVGLAKAHQASIARLPLEADTAFEELAEAQIEVNIDSQIFPLNVAISQIQNWLQTAKNSQTPTNEEVSPEVEVELEEQRRSLIELSALRAALIRDRALEETQVASLAERILSIDEDIQKNKDVLKLKSLGSKTAAISGLHSCPTCDQPVEDGLFSQKTKTEIMSVDDNINYLKEQRALFLSMHRQAQRSMREASANVDVLSENISQKSQRIRTLQASLILPGNIPSESVISERISRESKLFSLMHLNEEVGKNVTALKVISREYSDKKFSLSKMPRDNLLASDRETLDAFIKNVREQLAQYHFTTFSPADLNISDNYRLEKEGFEVRFQASASDGIRLKWAYQLGLLELDRTRDTNHLGLVIFDEPRQQSAREQSFDALLARAATSKLAAQQVIFATSEDLSHLSRALSSLDANLQVIKGWVLKRILD